MNEHDLESCPVRFSPLALAALVLASLTAACGDPAPPTAPPSTVVGSATSGAAGAALDVPTEVLVARERAAALFEQDRITAALAELEPLLLRPVVDPSDQVRVAICVRELGDDPTRAESLLRAALARDDTSAAAHYVLGRHLFELGDARGALTEIQRAAALAPDDYPTKLALGAVSFEVGDADGNEALVDRSESIFRELFERGVEFGGSWYLTVAYRYGRLLIDRDRPDEGRAVLARWNELKQRAVPEPTSRDLLRGSLGRLIAPAPLARASAPPRGATSYLARARFEGLPMPGHALVMTRNEAWHAVQAGDVEGGQPQAAGAPLRSVLTPGELFWASSDGLWRLDLAGTKERVLTGDFTHCAAIELGEERETRAEVRGEIDGQPYRVRSASSDLELVVARGEEVLLYTTEEDGSWTAEPAGVAKFEGAVFDLVPSDVDHDGDLDVVVAGAFGAAVLRHDGTGAGGTFEVVPFDQKTGALDWIVTEDFDTDQDVDVLVGGTGGRFLFDNERGGAWREVGARMPKALASARAPLVLDLDADGLPDVVPSAGDGWYGNVMGEVFQLRTGGLVGAELAFDTGASGAPDLVAAQGSDVVATRADGSQRAVLVADGASGALESDLDRNGRAELVTWRAGTVLVHERAESPATHAFCIALEGVKDNARGVGAVVELRAGALYRRIYWRGEPIAIGLGRATTADVVRVTWPNGVVQSFLDVPAGRPLLFEQSEGLVGSCPFLYSWNGTTFEFVSDVIGITPLGLPMAPGMFVPPDHDEFVLVRAEQLVPKDGELVVQLTEELREVTYFDAVHLEAIDHPLGSEIFPNERFTFPPFPEPKIHTVTRSHAALRALGSDGRDWAPELAAVDTQMAIPFTAHRGQFAGLATPHWLELEFDPKETATAIAPRLLMTGWLYWTDASVNMASARHPGYEFVPPIIEVPDGQGGWRPIGPPVGFPAGKTKTMVIDLEGHLDRNDPRVRVSSTLRLYWDEIRLATCDGAAPLVKTVLPPLAATLWERGFSEPVMLAGDARLEWFDWEHLAPAPRWNQHPGLYTRLGHVLPLLESIDDELVVMGAGDALTVRFDARGLPPVREGWRRDWLVFLDGWAKDRDPNTNSALFVEPLPFHAMSGYPPLPTDAAPSGQAARDWQRIWNTRPARRLIEALVPSR